MKFLRTTAAAVCLAAGVTVTVSADDKNRDKPAAVKLEGGYTIVKGEENGQSVPDDRIKGAIVKFTADEVIGTDKDKKHLFAAKYTLDTSREPWKITMKSTTPKESEAVGLIKKDGDTIVLIYALPGGKPPTEFKTGDKQNMFWLKNMNK